MVLLASTTCTCCNIQPFRALPWLRCRCMATFLSWCFVTFFPAAMSAASLASCRIRFCSLFHSRCLAAATSLYVTKPTTLLSSSTTGRERTSYLINRSSTCFSVIVGFAERTGEVMKSPTVGCFTRLVSIISATIPWRMPPASLSSPSLTVADAALACPPPPNCWKRVLRLTSLVLMPALTRPMMIIVDWRRPVSFSCSDCFFSTSSENARNSSKSILPSPFVSIVFISLSNESSEQIMPEDAKTATISLRSRYPEPSISFLSNAALNFLLFMAISPPFHESVAISFCSISIICSFSFSSSPNRRVWMWWPTSSLDLFLFFRFLPLPDLASYTTVRR
mmetsp:Transcript_18388/g.52699  ORF Transcript_18388/g.52699 Transcript_18388/m.52699 type:complete len:337 (+) Transcript_18388:1965-2975(+)